jgi:hypothetical protein
MQYNIKLKVIDQNSNILENTILKNVVSNNMTVSEIKSLVNLQSYPNITSSTFKVNNQVANDSELITRFSFLSYTVNCTV